MRKLNHREKAHLRYLLNRKNELFDRFKGAENEINQQIEDVKNCVWYDQTEREETDGKE